MSTRLTCIATKRQVPLSKNRSKIIPSMGMGMLTILPASPLNNRKSLQLLKTKLREMTNKLRKRPKLSPLRYQKRVIKMLSRKNSVEKMDLIQNSHLSLRRMKVQVKMRKMILIKVLMQMLYLKKKWIYQSRWLTRNILTRVPRLLLVQSRTH